MQQQKKRRGENWSSEEKEILRQLISQSAHIIEDKSTKTSVNIMKTKEWKNILIKFNDLSEKHRSDAELKLAWKRMKLSAKANVSAHRRELTMTGGGKKPPSPSTEDLQVMAIAPHDFVNEVNDYDSDAVIPVTMAAKTKDMFADPKPCSSNEGTEEAININEENSEQIVIEVQAIYDTTNETESGKTGMTTNNAMVDNRNPIKKTKKKSLQNKIRTEEMRQSILQSNTNFKIRQLEMLEVEHQFNGDTESMQIVSIISYLFVMLCQLFICCWCGHELTVTNEDLHTVMYKCLWYEQDLKFKRDFCFAMMRTSRPLVLRAGHYISMSRQTFVAVLRMSYSYFAVLNQTNKTDH